MDMEHPCGLVRAYNPYWFEDASIEDVALAFHCIAVAWRNESVVIDVPTDGAAVAMERLQGGGCFPGLRMHWSEKGPRLLKIEYSTNAS